MEAGEAGADYVAFGAFFPTNTTETLHRPDPSILSWWSALFAPPCVAIGGMTVANAKPLVVAGDAKRDEQGQSGTVVVGHGGWGVFKKYKREKIKKTTTRQ